MIITDLFFLRRPVQCSTLARFIRILLSFALLICAVYGDAWDCEKTSDCGQKSLCVNQTCSCEDGYTQHPNLKDCVNASCPSQDCVICTQGTCQRCVHFIDKQTRKCLHTCTGKAEMIYTGDVQGSVCTQSSGSSDMSDIIIGVVAGVSAGILLCVILGLCLHFHLKRKRGQVNLQSRHLHTNTMEMGQMRKIPVFENKGFIVHPEAPVIDKEAYLKEVERLKPSAQMLLDLLNQIRKRVRAMEENDTRIPTYKGVIHQLCRVLVMLNKKDPASSVPADGLSLLEWAKQMLQDYVETRQSLEDVDPEDEVRAGQFTTSVTPETISTTLNSEQPVNVVYATPGSTLDRGKSSSRNGTLTAHPENITVYPSPLPAQSIAHQGTIVTHPTVVATHPAQTRARHSPGHYSSVPVPYIDKHIHTNGTLRLGQTVVVSSPTMPAENSGESGESHGIRSGYKQYPNPRPVVSHNPAGPALLEPKGSPDIYAPASSYSDYAQPKISTFSGGVARSLSTHSGSNCSFDSDDEPNPDGLPFDPEDATEPVEV